MTLAQAFASCSMTRENEVTPAQFVAAGGPANTYVGGADMADRICSVSGCAQSVKPGGARGMCCTHYQRWRKHGDPHVVLIGKGLPCKAEGCDLPAMGRGWCTKHYTRWRRNGDPTVTSRIVGDDEARFWQKVDKNDPLTTVRPDLGPCWLWVGTRTLDGYGCFGVNVDGADRRVTVRAHRYVYERLVGPIPAGAQVDHICHNLAAEAGLCRGGDTCVHRACCNPAHLEAVSGKTNALRSLGVTAVNARKTHCVRGHELTPENIRLSRTRGRECQLCKQSYNAEYRAKRVSQPKEAWRTDLGEIIRNCRRALGFSQTSLGQVTGRGQTTISAVELGDAASADLVVGLVAALGDEADRLNREETR